MMIREIYMGYLNSPDFKGLKSSTQKVYEYGLSYWQGHLDEDFSAADTTAYAIKDELWETRPGMCRMFVAASSAMFNWALRRRWIDHNPCLKMPKPKLQEYRKWSDDAIASFLTSDLPSEEDKLLVMFGLYTGQRLGDIIKAEWDQFDINSKGYVSKWRLVQSKTGKEVVIPILPALSVKLTPGEGKLFDGFRMKTTSDRISSLMHRIGYKLSFHGLRKAAISRLAEAGCSSMEIASISGHTTLGMLEHYTREVSQEKMAESAITKMESHEGSYGNT